MARTVTMLAWFCALTLVLGCATAQTKTKRQIYREQVLPRSGGKIPDGAFRADRLALNRLNKEGISVPDGVLLEHRSVHSHPHYNKHDPEDEESVLKIIQQSENRFTPLEGTYHNENPLTVASTYLIRKPIGREETNIRTPDQQRPHYKSVLSKQGEDFLSNYQYEPPRYHQQSLTPSSLNNHPRYQSYQHVEHKPQAYHPIPVSFELPNKEVHDDYYLKQYDASYPSTSDNLSGKLSWSSWLETIDRLPSDLNSLLPPSRYDYDSPPYQYFHSQEPSMSNFESFAGFFGERFARKSAESHLKGSDSKKRRTNLKELNKSSYLLKRLA